MDKNRENPLVESRPFGGCLGVDMGVMMLAGGEDMRRLWTVVEKVGKEYFYQIQAESKQEAIDKVKRGEADTAKHTKEMEPTYNAH